jgi:hypothetical protein
MLPKAIRQEAKGDYLAILPTHGQYNKFQFVNTPSRTLVDMTEGEQERVLLKLTEDILRRVE